MTNKLRPADLHDLLDWGRDVTRWHGMPNIKEQNLADHSWGVAMMVMRLFQGSSRDKLLLVHAALEHDLAEKFVGDMPRPYRTEEHKAAEARIALDVGIVHEVALTDELRNWLSWADLIEAAMHAQREIRLGNTRYFEVVGRVRNYLGENEALVPPELWDFACALELTPTEDGF